MLGITTRDGAAVSEAGPVQGGEQSRSAIHVDLISTEMFGLHTPVALAARSSGRHCRRFLQPVAPTPVT